MSDYYIPQLGQYLFGNYCGEYKVPDEVDDFIREICELLGLDSCYAGDFVTERLEIHPYWWGDCTCGADKLEDDTAHLPNCRIVMPNFRFDDLMIWWYKYIGRGMSCNKNLSVDEFIKILIDCKNYIISSFANK